MKSISRPLLTIFLTVLLSFTISGCWGDREPQLSPEEIIQESAKRMQGATAFKFLFDRSGAPAFLDAEQTYSLSKMEGVFVAPDSIKAKVRVITPGVVADVNIISIGKRQWETNVFTQQWQEIPEDWGFNPGRLLDPQIGLQAILATDLTELAQGGKEELDEMPGKKLYTLTGKLDGDTLYELSYGLLGPEQMAVKLWISPGTFELYRALITEFPGNAEKESVWQVDFWDFDLTEDIVPPL